MLASLTRNAQIVTLPGESLTESMLCLTMPQMEHDENEGQVATLLVRVECAVLIIAQVAIAISVAANVGGLLVN